MFDLNNNNNNNKIILETSSHWSLPCDIIYNNNYDEIIIINEKPHSIFKRKGNDLFITIELKLFQAIFGFDKIIEHLDKRKLHISHTNRTEHDTVRKIAGEGMHILNGSGGKGDLYIKFTVKLPLTNDFEVSSKLQYLLRTLDNEESMNETIVKNSKNNYSNFKCRAILVTED